MKKFEEKQETRTVKRWVDLQCDLCKRSTGPRCEWDGNGNTNEITVEYQHGNVWPEGDFTETEFFDLCPSCWKRLKEWLWSEGAELQVRGNE